MTTPHEGMAPFDAVLDRYFKERLTALLSDPATVERVAEYIADSQNESPDGSRTDQCFVTQEHHRIAAKYALQAIKEMIK